MDKNKYFQPDYRLLNRKARRLTEIENKEQPGGMLSWLLPWKTKIKPIRKDPELFIKLSDTISRIKKNIDWGQDLFSSSYVAFDLETTGLHPLQGDEITSIGAVIIENGKILDKPTFYQLVNPGRRVSAQSQEITGLSDKMLRDKPEIGTVLLDFLEFAGPRILIAHNAPFDLAFINNKLGEAIDRRIVNPVIDTVLLTSALFYSIGDFSLENLAPHFGLDIEGRHHALADARIAASLFLKLLPELKTRKVKTLHQLAQLMDDVDPAKGYPLIF